MELIIYLALFSVSIAVLVKSSDFFTDAAEKLGVLIGLPSFIIGVTIVSVGTSLPELISSLFAVFRDSSEIVVGNVVGSNIANIFLVIGTASVLGYRKSIEITYNLVSVDLPLFVGSAFLLALQVWDGTFTRGEALFLIFGYLMYLFYTFSENKEEPKEESEEGEEDEEGEEGEEGEIKKDGKTFAVQFTILILSSIGLYFGAKYTIDSLIKTSEILDIGREVIAVTAVALGTSLPELVVTVNASFKGKAELAVGNVLGSNIFNIFMVMGVPGLISPLIIPETVIVGAMPTLIAGTLLLFFVAQDNKLTMWEGWLFYLFYGWFIGTTFGLV